VGDLSVRCGRHPEHSCHPKTDPHNEQSIIQFMRINRTGPEEVFCFYALPDSLFLVIL
jgi:hypothetical protein